MSNNPYMNPVSDSTALPPTSRLLKVAVRVFLICLAAVVAVLLVTPFARTARPAAKRMACGNNLRQIGLALLNYQVQYGSFPPAYTVDSEGQRLHSWRTLILPYLEQAPLYDQIDLTKPWNDPVNAALFQLHLGVYSCPEIPGSGNQTAYLAVVGENTPLRPWDDRSVDEHAQVMNETIMVVEVPLLRAVPWMEPVDVNEQELGTILNVNGHLHANGTNALSTDASITFISEGAYEEHLFELSQDNDDFSND